VWDVRLTGRACSRHQCVMDSDTSIWIVANTTWYVFNFRSQLIRQLTQHGYSVTVLSPVDEYVARIRALGVQYIPLKMDNGGTNPIRDAALLARLITCLRKERPDLLLTYTPKVNIFCSIAANWTKIPVIANVSGLGTGFLRGGWLTAIMKLLYRLALRHPSWVFFQNEDDRLQFVRDGLVASDRTDRLPGSGVDVQRFKPVPKADGGKFVFLFVGRLLTDKGIREFVAAARLVRSKLLDAECRVLGFIDYRNPTAISMDEVRGWEAEGIIRYLGSVDDVTPHLTEATCVVLPSYREGCPRSLLEAASMSIPLIATDVPGCRQVVEDGVNGFLCRPYDAGNLAEKMTNMFYLRDVERRQMGAAGRVKMLNEFDEKIVLDRYLDAIRKFATK
jgi:glycosyltransferase involved in cell wall biosynthesis